MTMPDDTRDLFLSGLRRFVRERLVPHEAQLEEDGAVPEPLLREMKEMGLFGLGTPEKYGGLGLNMREEALAIMEIAWASPGFRATIGANNGLSSHGLIAEGTKEQRETFLPRMAAGDVASFALTEPEAGSDAASLKTRARRENDGYVLSGSKRYITNADRSSLMIVMARTDPDESTSAGVSAFILASDTPGISFGKPEVKMGLRGSTICDVRFDDVRVPESALIGGVEGRGFKMAMHTLNRARLQVAAAAVGNAKRLRHEMLHYAMNRRQFGKPLADFQMVQAMIAESETEILAGESMVLATAAAADAGQDIRVNASCCKLFASEMVGRVADRAVQVFGGAGYIADYGIERFYRDVRIYRLYEGTSEIQKIIIAKALVKQAEN